MPRKGWFEIDLSMITKCVTMLRVGQIGLCTGKGNSLITRGTKDLLQIVLALCGRDSKLRVDETGGITTNRTNIDA